MYFRCSATRCQQGAISERYHVRTVVEARQADLQPVKGWQPVLLLEGSHVHVTAFYPLCAHRLQPCRQQHPDILA